MDVTSATADSATVAFTRAEVLAIRNLVEHAGRLPLELRGPVAIFDELFAAFDDLGYQMTAGRAGERGLE
jgi:hypothetical protein